MGALVVGGELGTRLVRRWRLSGLEALSEQYRRLRHLLDRRQEEAEMDEELRFHLEMEAENNARAGMTDAEARRAAAVAFGGTEGHRERIREARGLPLLENFWRDVKYAGRSFWRDRTFTLIAIAILGVGLGVGSGVMAFLNYAAFEPLPGIQRPEEVARIEFLHRANWGTLRAVEGDERIAYLEAQSSFAAVGGLATHFDVLPADLGDRVERVSVDVAIGQYFEALQLDMAVGRGLVDGNTEDDQAVVLSHRFWKSYFGSSPDVLGRVIRLNGIPTEIIGVGPEAFPSEGEVWLTEGGANLRRGPTSGPHREDAEWNAWNLVGRLKPGITRAQAAAEANAIAATLPEILVPDRYDTPVIGASVGAPTLVSWEESLPAVAALAGLTLLLLMVVCANLGVLLLGRALARRQEISVRIALGASRKRLLRQLLTEGVVLAILGSIAAILGIWAASRITLSIQGVQFALVPSWQTSLLTIGLAAVVGVVFSVAPALHATLGSIRSAMADSAGAGSRRGVRLQRGLVVGSFTLASGLASVAGLIIVWVFQTTGPTTRAEISEQVTVISTRPQSLGYLQRQVPELADRFGSRLARIPGVESVAYAHAPPEATEGYGTHVPGMTEEEYVRGARPSVITDYAGPGYFRTLGIPLLSGREFLPSDDAGAPQSVIVGREVADRLWPGLNAIGRILEFERVDGDERTADQAMVVGVTGGSGRVSNGGFASETAPVVYFPVAQRRDNLDQRAQLTLFVRTREDAGPAMMGALRAALLEIEPELLIYDIETTRERHWKENEQELVGAYAAAIGGTAILLIAAVGVYGVITFRLNQRRREVAITRALGAWEGQVVFGSFREGMTLSLTGMALGWLICLVLGRFLYAGQLLQPGAVALVTSTLIAAAAIACWLPARRAARIQPMEVLRV